MFSDMCPCLIDSYTLAHYRPGKTLAKYKENKLRKGMPKFTNINKWIEWNKTATAITDHNVLTNKVVARQCRTYVSIIRNSVIIVSTETALNRLQSSYK